jgi:hypothetical protein
MRYIASSALALLLLSSCASQNIEGARVYGRIHSVTPADIHAAMEADRKINRDERIYEVDVISKDEMHVYHDRRLEGSWNHSIIRRIKGHWEHAGSEMYTS